ncbi:MAG: hypothetical protein HQ581_13375, partial [Planctomycetes bacterium]|nr:hypothetical protein [Planctomycetota bacterium]
MLHQRGKSQDGSFAVLADEAVRKKLLGSVRLDRVLHFADQCPQCVGDPVALHVSVLDRREFGEHLLETHRRLAELGGPAADTFRKVAEQLGKELDGLSS